MSPNVIQQEINPSLALGKGADEVLSLFVLMCECYLFESSWLMWSGRLFLVGYCSSLVDHKYSLQYV